MNLSIIIVSYNTSLLLKKCLQSVTKALSFCGRTIKGEVIIIDNASSDDSVKMVKKNFPKVILIANKKNLGFAVANNQGIKISKGKYLLLLNSDTEVEKDAFLKLIEVMEKNRKVGVLGTKLLNVDGSIQPSVGFSPSLVRVFFWMTFIDDLPGIGRFLTPYHVEGKEFYKKQQNVDWVTGACFLVRREIIGVAGVLDEKIFMYGEEMEWCYRIKKAGFQILYTPVTPVVHLKGESSTKADTAGIEQEFQSLLYFYRKHKPFWQIPLIKMMLTLGALLRMAIFGIIRKYPNRVSLYAKALKMVGQ